MPEPTIPSAAQDVPEVHSSVEGGIGDFEALRLTAQQQALALSQTIEAMKSLQVEIERHGLMPMDGLTSEAQPPTE